MSKAFPCESCDKSYQSKRGLRDHYSKNQTHHLTAARRGKVAVLAKDCVEELLGVSEKYEASHLKELLNQLTIEDICEYVFPSLSKRIDLYEHFLSKINALPTIYCLTKFLKTVKQKHFGEFNHALTCLGYIEPSSSTKVPFTASNFVNIPSQNSVSHNFVQARNDLQLSNLTTPAVNLCFENRSASNNPKLVKVSVDLVTSLDVSRRDYQLVLRNSIGKQIEDVIKINPFVPRYIMERNLKQRSEKYKQDFEIKFASWNGTVTGYVNVQKAIQWILSNESLRNIIKVPNDIVIAYFYVDLFPWMAWSRFFQGQASIRIKILESTNTYEAVATVVSWLGPDKSDFVSSLGQHFFNQMQTTTDVFHPLLKRQVQVMNE